MCRLLSLLANKPVDLRFSLFDGASTLKKLSEHNQDGWGLGWYDATGQPLVVREAAPAHECETYARTSAEACSQTFIAHVRQASVGERVKENAHPFRHGSWLFAHNGSIYDRDGLLKRLETRHSEAIVGTTDSEVFFHWILQNIEREEDVLDGIEVALQEIHNYTALNFLLSNGSEVYAYREAKQHPNYYSLFYLVRKPSTREPVAFRSKEVASLLESKSLQGEKAVLACSEVLTHDEPWKEIPARHILRVNARLVPELHQVR